MKPMERSTLRIGEKNYLATDSQIPSAARFTLRTTHAFRTQKERGPAPLGRLQLTPPESQQQDIAPCKTGELAHVNKCFGNIHPAN